MQRLAAQSHSTQPRLRYRAYTLKDLEALANRPRIGEITDLLDYPVIDPETNADGYFQWAYPTLYKMNAKGKDQEWTILANLYASQYYVRYGQVGSAKMRVTSGNLSTNASGRSLTEQFTLEMRRRYTDKRIIDRYLRAGEDPGEEFLEEMSAQTWSPETTFVEHETPQQRAASKKLNYPVGVEPKLDGLRLMIKRREDGTLRFRSRSNQLYDQLEPYFGEEVHSLLDQLEVGAELDSELHYPGADSNAIHSIMTNAATLPQRANQLFCNLFTYISPSPLDAETRYNQLSSALERYRATRSGTVQLMTSSDPTETTSPSLISNEELVTNSIRINEVESPVNFLQLVPMNLAYSQEEVLAWHATYIAAGFEGTMIYRLIVESVPELDHYALYAHSRAQNLLKYKDFLDREGVIVKLEPARGGNEIGAAILVLYDPELGKVLRARPMGDVESRRRMIDYESDHLGKWYTYRYQEIRNNRAPRFPIGVRFRDEYGRVDLQTLRGYQSQSRVELSTELTEGESTVQS